MLDQAGIQIAQGNSIACERIVGVNDNMTKSHFHSYFELYYLEHGERYHMMNDDLYCIQSGEFILFAPYVMHHSYGEENVTFKRILVYFTPDQIKDQNILTALMQKSGAFKTDHRTSQAVHDLMDHILKEQTTPNLYSEEYMQSLLDQLIIEILRLDQQPAIPESNNRIGNVLNYIHEHYNDEISLEQLAQLSYISSYYLCREFKRVTNRTIVQYINTTRIMNAQRMIMETNRNFTEISQLTGFSSVTHFNRVFKQITGTTPSAYRHG